MKRLLLAVLLVVPTLQANDTSISENWRKFNSYRLVSAVKATLQGTMAAYAGWRALTTVGACSDEIRELIEHRTRRQLQDTLDSSVLCGGMAYTSYLLACYAWANTKHALAIK